MTTAVAAAAVQPRTTPADPDDAVAAIATAICRDKTGRHWVAVNVSGTRGRERTWAEESWTPGDVVKAVLESPICNFLDFANGDRQMTFYAHGRQVCVLVGKLGPLPSPGQGTTWEGKAAAYFDQAKQWGLDTTPLEHEAARFGARAITAALLGIGEVAAELVRKMERNGS